MWFLLLYLVAATQGQNRIALQGSDSPCKGRLEVYNGTQWGLVCYHEWINGQSHKNGEVVCKSLGCGEHVKSGHNKYTYRKPAPPTSFFMDEVKCNGKESSLWECKTSRDAPCPADNYVVVECTGSIKLQLNKNGKTENECAGVVQFKRNSDVVTVCNTEWNEARADTVCKELNCGKHYKIPKSGTFNKGKHQSSYNVPLSCTGNEKFSWQCVDWVKAKSNTCQEEANVICSNYKSFRLKSDSGNVCSGQLEKEDSTTDDKWAPVIYEKKLNETADDICSKLNCGKYSNMRQCEESNNTCLTCADKVKVELENGCHGDIYVNLNETRQIVCHDGLSEEELRRMGNVVCRELKCGTLLTVSNGDEGQNGLLSKVDCSGGEKSLWHCLAKYERGQSCSSTRVACTAFETVTLQDGLGNCSGRLQVTFEGSQWSLSASDWTQENSNVVCKQLGCGSSRKQTANLFVKSKHPQLKWNLKCSDGNKDLSQCSWTQRDSQSQNKNFVNIFCTNEKLWYLKGDSPCRGELKVESDEQSWFINTTEKETDFCQLLHCGHSLTPNPANSSSTITSTNVTLPVNNKRVHVHCSGSIEVKLENNKKEKCWGEVTVCMDGKCGGVCKDTWIKSHSDMLCGDLGCGKSVGEYLDKSNHAMTVASVHCSQETQNLSQCYFALMSKHSVCKDSVHVSCTDSLKAQFKDPRDRCAGRVELFHLGKWLPVCLQGVSQETQTTFCTSMGCGETRNLTKHGVSKASGLSGVTCTTDMSTCNINPTETCDISHLKCTGWRRLLLTNPDHACSGKVYAWDQHGLTAVSNEGWETTKRNKLCRYLNCGQFISNYSEETIQQRDKSYTCTKKPDTFLDCEFKETAQLQHLNITCDGNPEVKLLGNCTGEVMINQNNRMCGNSHNTDRVLGELCHHLHCRKFITSWTANYKDEAQYFSCSGHENRLWQCNSWKDSCDTVISVACAGGVEFNFTEECGGELQVRYQGEWEPVCLNSIADADVICRYKGCGKAEHFENSDAYSDAKMSLKCENERVSDPVDCIKYESCRPSKATIKCEKHVPVVVVVPPNSGLIAGVVVGLLFLLVAIVIVIWQRKRFLALLRLKPSRGDQDIELSNKEMQDLNDKNRDLSDRKSSVFEIDDYEDIDPIMNQMEDKSKSPDEDENRSTSGDSSRTEYDDVEETGDRPQEPANSSPIEPLLPPRPANLLDDASSEGEQDDYDDAVPTRAVVSDAEESSFSESQVADMAVEPDD